MPFSPVSPRLIGPARIPLLLLLALFPTGCSTERAADATPGRAILVSIDAMSESIFRATLTPGEAPALYRIFSDGRCAEYAVSHFPSVTAPSHAVLWTGAYGDVSGVVANLQPRLPRSENTLLDLERGFSYEALSAEPLWIAAGRAGVPVVGHHVTQAPGVPGYHGIDGPRSPEQEARRAESAAALAHPFVNVVNGYNTQLGNHRVVTAATARPGAVDGWEGVESLHSTLPPVAWEWETGAGTAYALIHAEGESYDAVAVGFERRVDRAVIARAHPVERAPPEGRELARYFSDAAELEVEGGRVYLRVRLFEVAADGSDFSLFHPSLDVVEGNRPEMQAEYDRAVRGWANASTLAPYRFGAFGTPVYEGGDGAAEARYLETAEYLLKQFQVGSEWMWRTFEPRLMMDYFPVSDSADHELLGYLQTAYPGHDPEVARQMRDFRARIWKLVDMRMEHLMALAEASGAALFLSGDHGMRTSWTQILPNAVLRDAGLLALDAEGGIDLSRTRALSPSGYFVSVNRTAWKEGIVPPAEEAEVIREVRAALEGVRDEDGVQVMPRTWIPEEAPEYGMGGPAGGDVYWDLAPGYRASSQWAGAPVGPARLDTGHGFTPDSPEMLTVFCAWGAGFTPGRIGGVRTTSVAPTVAEFTGIPAPRDAVGPSVLEALLERR